MVEKRMIIAVIGGSVCSAAEAAQAEEVGRLIADRGATLVCGGLGGIMEAACRGAERAGGFTIGILPGNDPDEANPYVTLPLATGIGYARNAIVVRSAVAVIAVSGSYGTLSEISYARQYGKPVVGLGTWELLHHGKPDETIIKAGDPAEAVALAFSLAGNA
jgi:uncharacterized protein (TIGR00725 family)